MRYQSEVNLENELIKQLETLDYEFVNITCEDEVKDNLKSQLEMLNKTEFSDAEFSKILLFLESGNIYRKAKKLRERMDLTRDNNKVEYIKFFDKRWCKNNFQVAHQITMNRKYTNRYDVTILINGLPLVQIELKRRGIELKQAFNQTKRYQQQTYTGLFQYIQIFIISNGVDTKYYANNKDLNYKFTFFWKDENNRNINNLSEFTDIFLERYHIHKMINEYIVLSDTTRTITVLRAYQYHAVEAILESALHSRKNGYIWHTTGSGKTLTSFKASQILSEKKEINKVLFIVDRRDLDSQTLSEFNKFSNDSVDATDDTKKLVKQLKGTDKLIVTTIQKLSNAVKNNKKELEEIRDQKMIFMFDECHRSQFGKMHEAIQKFFNNIQIFGFTGTPIFEDNSNNTRTTHDIFGERLHQYLIKDAINDQNVLGFSVDYCHGKYENVTKNDILVEDIDTKEVLMSEKRLEKIVDFIIRIHDAKTYNRSFTSIFTVENIDMLNKYYQIFKKKNSTLPEDKKLKIATIYTFDENPDIDCGKKHPREILDDQIEDYNQIFKTNFSTDSSSFQLYYRDISKKSKENKIDILLVVNMFLTGFDNKLLNTLYVDKNMDYHNLIQAYSRTNRVYDEKKSHGNIVCFRNLKEKTDDAIALFSDENASEIVLMKPYESYVENFNNKTQELYAEVHDIKELDTSEGIELQENFVNIFRSLLRIMNKLKTFTEFTFNDLDITEQEFEDYTSKYQDLYEQTINPTIKTSILNDVDFEIGLLQRDDINVQYIIKLLEQLNPKEQGIEYDLKFILDQMNKTIELRNKKELIDNFIKKMIIEENTPYVEEALLKFMENEKTEEINNLIEEEKLKKELTIDLIKKYEFTGKIKATKIDELFIEEFNLNKRRSKRKKIKQRIENLIDLYSF